MLPSSGFVYIKPAFQCTAAGGDEVFALGRLGCRRFINLIIGVITVIDNHFELNIAEPGN